MTFTVIGAVSDDAIGQLLSAIWFFYLVYLITIAAIRHRHTLPGDLVTVRDDQGFKIAIVLDNSDGLVRLGVENRFQSRRPVCIRLGTLRELLKAYHGAANAVNLSFATFVALEPKLVWHRRLS